MGKFGKETKILLLAITTICVISFLLATGISFFLAKGSQQELLLHDYGVSGYQCLRCILKDCMMYIR